MPNTTEFSLCRSDPEERRHRSPWCPNGLREPEAPPRPSAGESPRPAAAARSPPPRKGDSTTLCASGSLQQLLLRRRTPPPPQPACPFVGELRRRLRGRGRGSERGRPAAPPGKRTRVRAPRGSLFPGGGGRAGPLPGPAPPPALPRPLGSRPPAPPPQAQQLCSGEQHPLGSGSARAGPRRPPRAGLGERGAPGHLTARPVNQHPPRAPSPPAAASPALGWPGAARPARLPVRATRREREWTPRTNTIPFIQITRKCESRPHPRQPRQFGRFCSLLEVNLHLPPPLTPPPFADVADL